MVKLKTDDWEFLKKVNRSQCFFLVQICTKNGTLFVFQKKYVFWHKCVPFFFKSKKACVLFFYQKCVPNFVSEKKHIPFLYHKCVPFFVYLFKKVMPCFFNINVYQFVVENVYWIYYFVLKICTICFVWIENPVFLP